MAAVGPTAANAAESWQWTLPRHSLAPLPDHFVTPNRVSKLSIVEWELAVLNYELSISTLHDDSAIRDQISELRRRKANVDAPIAKMYELVSK